MPIYYSLIARDTTVLVDHSENTGNFPQIAQTILAKVPREDTKCTYISGRYVVIKIMYIVYNYIRCLFWVYLWYSVAVGVHISSI